jgi:two-component system sensor histidine kinase KdpD
VTRQRAVRLAASLAAVAAVVVLYTDVIRVNQTTVALTLLLVILGISARWGLVEATIASVAAMLGFNFYFLPPVGTLTIDDPQNWVALLAFLATAVTASQLSTSARRRAAEAEARRRESEQLYSLLQAMMLSGSARRTIRDFVNRVVQVFGCNAAAVYYQPSGEFFRSGPESAPVTDHDLLAAAEVADVSIEGARRLAISPVRFGGRSLGSLALLAPLPSESALRAIVNLVAITIEKARALEDASQAEAARQSEALKSALLDSLAHDIKTPLTSIKAAVTSLIGTPAAPDPELLAIINEEADRLNHLSAEVIAMARVEAGKLHLDRKPVSPVELIEGALGELSVSIKGRLLEVRAPADLPAVDADPEFTQQVIKQLLENALRYSPGDSPVTVTAEADGGKIVFGVADQGPGIEEFERARLFDKFFRGRRHRFDTKGTGMGLAIAKGIVEAHGERIWVESEPGEGAAFYFTLPVSGGTEN